MHPTGKSNRGSITLVALCLAAVIGISLASYLALCQQSLLLSTRTLQLSRARQLAETGLEEALWSLNTAVNPITSIAATSWSNATWSTTGLYKSCTITGYTLGEGASGQITITIAHFNGPTTSPVIPSPTITSTAVVNVPGLGDFTKTLTATTKPAPLFANAISVLNGTLTIPAGTVIDSWDSDYDALAVSPTPNRDYNVSTPAVLYSSVSPLPPTSTSPRNYAAVVAAPSITLNGNATVYGYAATFGNLINNPSNLAIIKGPTTPAATKIDSDRVSKSAYIPTFTVKAPSPPAGFSWNYLPSNAAWGVGASQTIGTAGGPTQYWTTNTAEPSMDTPNGPGQDLFLNGDPSVPSVFQKLYVNGPVVLVVNEDFELKDSAQIIVNPTGRLELYARDDVIVRDTAGFQNLTGEAKNLALFCTSEYSTNFSFTYYTNEDFFGVLYSGDPDQSMVFTVSPTFHGAIWAGFAPFLSGPMLKIHYDTALQYLPKNWFKGVTTPFIIVQLTES